MADETEHYAGSLNLTGAGNDGPPKLGKHAYLAYSASRKDQTGIALQVRPWETQPEEVRNAWEAAALAVQREILD